jgi:hypothetical protein
MAKSLDESFVRAELAKEGWELLNGYKTDSTPIIIRNENIFNGCLCRTHYMTWRSGGRPAMESIIDQTEYVRIEFAKEGWELLSEYANSNEPLVLRHPEKFDGHTCKIKLGNWNFNKRPDFRSLVDKTEFVRQQFAKEGWELLSECRISSDQLLVRNPDFFDGVECRFTYNSWQQGVRPSALSIVDKRSLIEKEVSKEGWRLVEYQRASKDIIFITKEDFYEGALVKFTWWGWVAGRRPNMLSLVDPEAMIKQAMRKEGWRLKNKYTDCRSQLIIQHESKLNGFECKTRWDMWQMGCRPRFSSVIDKTGYVKNELEKINYEPIDKNWEFETYNSKFYVLDRSTNTEYKVSYSRVVSGYLPGTPKLIIRNRIRSFLEWKQEQRDFSITFKLFNDDFLDALEKKFPNIPKSWHIDHILPISWFGITWEQMMVANDIRNLRLLPAKENIARQNRLTVQDVNQYNLWDLLEKAENPMGYELIDASYKLAS